jgi:hypothetical protein
MKRSHLGNVSASSNKFRVENQIIDNNENVIHKV